MQRFKLSKLSVTDSQISILTFAQDILFYMLIGMGRLSCGFSRAFWSPRRPKGARCPIIYGRLCVERRSDLQTLGIRKKAPGKNIQGQEKGG